jgi:hypothetical protein
VRLRTELLTGRRFLEIGSDANQRLASDADF